jgi:hypothetical protein
MHNIISIRLWRQYITFRIIFFTKQIVVNDLQNLQQFNILHWG